MNINSIKVYFDKLVEVANTYFNSYKEIMLISNDYCKRINKILEEVKTVLDELKVDIGRLEAVLKELEQKMHIFQLKMDEENAKYESFSKKAEDIYNAGHWETTTSYDSEGNSHTSSSYVYDTAAYDRATKSADEALSKYKEAKEKYDELNDIYLKIKDELEYLYSLQKAVHMSYERLEEKQYIIFNSSNSIAKEIESNYNQLSNVIKSLENYKSHEPFWGDRINISLLDFSVMGIGQYDYYRNVHYDKFDKDKISVSSEDLNEKERRMIELGGNVRSSVSELKRFLDMADGHVDEKLLKSIGKYSDLLSKYTSYFDTVSDSCYLTMKTMNDSLMVYQNLSYKKGNYGDQ